VEMFDSTWGDYRTFECEMTFDSGFNCVLSGKEVWKKELDGVNGGANGVEDGSPKVKRKELRQKYGEGSHIYLNAALTERFVDGEEVTALTDRLKEEGATDETVELVKIVMMRKSSSVSSP